MRRSLLFIGGTLLMATIAAPPGNAGAGPVASLLAPCPSKPNCVSTLATGSHAIAPIHFTGSREQALQRLLAILHAMPRTTIVASDDRSIRAEFRTRVFHFIDDGMFVVDDGTKTIHFRSASRLGRRDFGVNRDRMEEIRAAFLAKGS